MSGNDEFSPGAIQASLSEITHVSRETIDALEQYRQLLLKWQAKTNLVSPSTLGQFWQRHVADSLQILEICKTSRQFVDLGSGGGFPGMVLAIVLAQEFPSEPGNVNLVESNHKKCAFLRQVKNEAGGFAEIYCERINPASAYFDQAQVVTARALTSLAGLLELTEGRIVNHCKACFHKGRGYLSEIENCHGDWEFDLVVHPSKVDTESVVLELSNVVRRNGSALPTL